jgi:hypothetical protein
MADDYTTRTTFNDLIRDGGDLSGLTLKPIEAAYLEFEGRDNYVGLQQVRGLYPHAHAPYVPRKLSWRARRREISMLMRDIASSMREIIHVLRGGI